MNSSSKTTKSRGTRAYETGSNLERFVEDILKRRGYMELQGDQKKQLFENIKTIDGKRYAKQVPIGTTIYETRRKCDFMVFNQERFPGGLVIECKWQQGSGSVDEKYPYLVLNIKKSKVPTIVLLAGEGYKGEAREWLKDQVDPEGPLIGVYDMTELHKAVNDDLLG